MQKEKLLRVLSEHKEAFGQTIADIKGFNPSICMYKIFLKKDYKPTVEAQRRLNLIIKEVVKKEVIKWLDADIIYPIFDSKWLSPVHFVPKKGGITVVSNESNELIPTRSVNEWTVFLDYYKLNKTTREDNFHFLLLTRCLKKIGRTWVFCILDGYFDYNQIVVAPKDKEKTTVTCPYGTFAFRRMTFGLYNASATFRRCMMAISDTIEQQ